MACVSTKDLLHTFYGLAHGSHLGGGGRDPDRARASQAVFQASVGGCQEDLTTQLPVELPYGRVDELTFPQIGIAELHLSVGGEASAKRRNLCSKDVVQIMRAPYVERDSVHFR